MPKQPTATALFGESDCAHVFKNLGGNGKFSKPRSAQAFICFGQKDFSVNHTVPVQLLILGEGKVESVTHSL